MERSGFKFNFGFGVGEGAFGYFGDGFVDFDFVVFEVLLDAGIVEFLLFLKYVRYFL